ncbi:MAG: hydantoinase/oxoprolinase family protein, partial [Anaerolineales bacterium]
QAIGRIEKPQLEGHPVQPNDGSAARLGTKTVADTTFARYDREKLRPGATLRGPALVFQLDSTTYIAPEWRATVDTYHNLILEKEN